MNFKHFSFTLLLSTILALPCAAFSSPSKGMSDRRKFKKAESYFTYAQYEFALPIFLEMLHDAPENWKLNYRIGVCYYYSTTARPRSVPYMDKALAASTNDTLPDLLYQAGLSYLCVNQFEKAENCFSAFRKKAGNKYKDQNLDQLIAGCITGETYWQHPAKTRITNLGSNVNSAYPDYAPVLVNKTNMLLFTSKRPGNTGNAKDDEGFYYEDVYQAQGASWNRYTTPSRYDTSDVKRRGIIALLFNKAEVVSEINTEDHDGSIALSPDSTDLYVFRYGDIMKAKWDGNRWLEPKRIDQEIDMRGSHEPSIFFSNDETSMLFVSDRKGGVGQKDIWICEKQGSKWGKPHNLGLQVNTPFNEDCPFLSPDGNTLYFSSEGHNSMGGYDVFRCTKQSNGTWSTPENLGAPVNNGGDDIFYTPLADGSGAYYSTLNRDGEGDLDIFYVQNYPDVNPLAKLKITAPNVAPSELITVRLSHGLSDVFHTFTMKSGDTIVYPYIPGENVTYEISSGAFATLSATLPFSAPDSEQYVFQSLNISNTDQSVNMELANYYFPIDSAINAAATQDPFHELPGMRTSYLNSLNSVNDITVNWTTNNATSSAITIPKDPTTNSAAFANVYFAFDRSLVTEAYVQGLNVLVDWMKTNPEKNIILTGHADETGDSTYNQRLSEQRARAVKSYLVQAGVSEKRITTIGKGETEPVVKTVRNRFMDTGSANRRVTIKAVQ